MDIEALLHTVIYLLCRDSNSNTLIGRIKELLEAVDREEPKFLEIYFEISCTLARLGGNNEDVMQLANTFLERALMLSPQESRYVSEMGYQQSLQRKYVKAMELYRKASKYDEANIQALYGTIYCQICQGLLDDAVGQV